MAFRVPEQILKLKHKSIIGQLVVILLAVELLFFSSFTALTLPTATGRNLTSYFHNQALSILPFLSSGVKTKILDRIPDLRQPAREVRFSFYVPITPVVIFLGYVLAEVAAGAAVLLFVTLGLLGPAFGLYALANGGGASYYQQPGFGYLLGMVIAAFIAGIFTAEKRTSLSQILAIVAGLLALHATGLIYMLGSCLAVTFLDGSHPAEWQQWLFEEARNLTWYQLPYDCLFSIFLLGLGFPFRWLVKVLTAPDIDLRSRLPVQLEEYL